MALDIGEKRIGVAVASYATMLASPLITLENDKELIKNLKEIVKTHKVDHLIVGLPRGLDGQTTKQTETVKAVASDIEAKLSLKVAFQDEALTSAKAHEELSGRGKIYTKADVDKLAACYILEDHIRDNF